MQLSGDWIDEEGDRHTGDLRAWGEWETESALLRKFNSQERGPRGPCCLWEPYYIPKNSYRDLHNTDPFIFGERFLYSNCGQESPNKSGLKYLGQGSVIAFGSGKMDRGRRRWVLDTVFVVRDFRDYDESDAPAELQDCVPTEFLIATGGPLADNGGKNRFRLYRGATPDDPAFGMFSLFPAIPASGKSGASFPRPFITLPDKYFNPANWQAPKGLRCDRSPELLRCLWGSLVEQVRDAGLVLGTRSEPPPLRPAN